MGAPKEPFVIATVVVLTTAAIATAAIAPASGGPAGTPEESAVLQVVRAGRAAVLENRPADLCALLTRRARRNSLLLHGLNRYPDGRRRPKARDCTTAVGYQIRDARAAGNLRHLRPGGRLHGARVKRLEGNHALVHKGRGPNPAEIELVKTKRGWRGDLADFAPFDGSSGY